VLPLGSRHLVGSGGENFASEVVMRFGWLVVMVLALAALFTPTGPAAGAAPHGGGEAHGQDATPDSVKDPQVPFGGWALDLTVWTIVVFLVLLYVLNKYAWKPIAQGLDQRERSIHEAVQDAQRARDEAAALRDDLQARINKAHEQVADMLDEARKEAQAARDHMLAEARGEVQAERERLHREIDMARDQALQQIWTQAAQLATLVSTKVIRRKLTPEDHSGLIEEALADLQRAAEQRQHTVASLQ
jgi:F-type H+-transporting ATPase subunit b